MMPCKLNGSGALAGATGAGVFEPDWNVAESTTIPEIPQSPRLAVIVVHRRHELANGHAVLVRDLAGLFLRGLP
jgi:hypothetical protein